MTATNRNHTHTGACQACGRDSALNIATQFVAKHGYEVHGVFVGTCPGSDRLPAQLSIEFTFIVIDGCTRVAEANEVKAENLLMLVTNPEHVRRWDPNAECRRHGRVSKGDHVNIAYAEGTEAEQTSMRTMLVAHHNNEARNNRDHVKFLRAEVLPLNGQPLTSVEQAAVRKAEARAAKGPTKQSFKDRQSKLSYSYYKVRDEIQQLLLDKRGDSESTDAFNAAYYAMPYSLAHYRSAKHRKLVLAYADCNALLDECDKLYAARAEVDAERKAAGL